mmetsp:Transcript_3309/g.13628  ORF Transcript_3309/g.13628 Transcript_3309/m.13628 type:complete len:393 (+) Transcript_3309:2979-4157(+)
MESSAVLHCPRCNSPLARRPLPLAHACPHPHPRTRTQPADECPPSGVAFGGAVNRTCRRGWVPAQARAPLPALEHCCSPRPRCREGQSRRRSRCAAEQQWLGWPKLPEEEPERPQTDRSQCRRCRRRRRRRRAEPVRERARARRTGLPACRRRPPALAPAAAAAAARARNGQWRRRSPEDGRAQRRFRGAARGRGHRPTSSPSAALPRRQPHAAAPKPGRTCLRPTAASPWRQSRLRLRRWQPASVRRRCRCSRGVPCRPSGARLPQKTGGRRRQGSRPCPPTSSEARPLRPGLARGQGRAQATLRCRTSRRSRRRHAWSATLLSMPLLRARALARARARARALGRERRWLPRSGRGDGSLTQSRQRGGGPSGWTRRRRCWQQPCAWCPAPP